MTYRSPDDHRPEWYRWLERLFDGLLHGARLLIWVWGLAIFGLVLYGIWISLFRSAP